MSLIQPECAAIIYKSERELFSLPVQDTNRSEKIKGLEQTKKPKKSKTESKFFSCLIAQDT